MTDLSTQSHSPAPTRLDRVWIAIAVIVAGVALVTPADLIPVVTETAGSLGHTAIFIAFAVFAVGYMKASGSETLLARAFEGRESRMIIAGALAGGLSPFCSCEVIPFIAAMLVLGAPLSAVMAFWLASPLMDPAMFFITLSALGLPFAIAKTLAAVGLGLFGGFGVRLLTPSGFFADPLREQTAPSGCCSTKKPFEGAPVWAFWSESERVSVFWATVRQNGAFLLKWLALAYLIEALMIRHIPAELIAGVLGGDGVQPVILGALFGGPAYLNGYAAVPLISGLLDQGMSQGAAMSFVLAGGVSCIPASLAVWALVKPRIFVGYLGFAFTGSVLAGLIWSAVV